MKLPEILSYFSDIKKLPGLQVDIHFKIKRKKNGKFNGVEYKPEYLLSNIERINPLEFRNDIIKIKSLRSKLSVETIETKLKTEIDKEYNRKLAIYIFNLLGSWIKFEYQRDIYNYPGFTSLQEKYPNEKDIKMLKINEDVNISSSLLSKPIFDYNVQKNGRKDHLRVFDNSQKVSYVIHNTDYDFVKGPQLMGSSIYSEEFYKLKRTILLDVKKINLNIYDHFGNLHKYTEYHKLGTINFDK